MKKLYFLMIMLLVSVCGAWAQTLQSGVYEIKNVSSENNVGRGYLIDYTGWEAGPSIGECPWSQFTANHPTERNNGSTTCSYWYLYNANGAYYLFSLSTLGENTQPKFLKIGKQGSDDVKRCTWQSEKNAIEIATNTSRSGAVSIRNAGVTAGNEYLSMGCGAESTSGCIKVDAFSDGGTQISFIAVDEDKLTPEQVILKDAGIAICASLTTFTVRIEGAPSEAQVTIDGQSYSNGDTFQASGVNISEATATEITGYDYTISLENESIIVVTYAEKPQYPVNFPVSSTLGNLDRRVNGLVLGEQTVNLEADNHNYRDLHETVIFEVDPGTTVKPGIIWSGSWMHGMLYVDLNQDGSFTLSNPEEMVAHTALNDSPDLRQGFGTFTIPETPGDYRMRFKTDWVGTDGVENGKDPAGRIGNDGTYNGPNSLVANSGSIIDVTLRVVSPEPHTYTYVVTLTNAPEGATIIVDGEEYADGATVSSSKKLTKNDVTAEAENYTTEVTVVEGSITVVYTYVDPTRVPVYSIVSPRGTLFAGEEILLSTCESSKAPLMTDENSQWVVVEGTEEHQIYLYNLGTKKFLNGNNLASGATESPATNAPMTDTPWPFYKWEHGMTGTNQSTGIPGQPNFDYPDYPWVIGEIEGRGTDSEYHTINVTTWMANGNGYRLCNTGSIDAGNAYAFTAVETISAEEYEAIRALVFPEPENPFTVAYDPDTKMITVTPANTEATYFWGIANDAVLTQQQFADNDSFFDGYLIPNFYSTDVCIGETSLSEDLYYVYWFYSLEEGQNYVLVANGYWDTEANTAVRTGDIYAYEIIVGDPTGVGTVLSQKASSEVIFNLQGQRLNKIQRGINIHNSKKVIK